MCSCRFARLTAATQLASVGPGGSLLLLSNVYTASRGQLPDDGFTGYEQFGGQGYARWGDYSAAMVSPGGRLFVASEYIPNPFARPRTKYTNWGTFIARVY